MKGISCDAPTMSPQKVLESFWVFNRCAPYGVFPFQLFVGEIKKFLRVQHFPECTSVETKDSHSRPYSKLSTYKKILKPIRKSAEVNSHWIFPNLHVPPSFQAINQLVL
jgi:hypothetical protein